MNQFDAHDEQMLQEATERLGDLVAGGQHPTQALAKVASDLRLLPGRTRIVGSIFNNAQQLAAVKQGKTAADKFGEVDLADIDAAIGEVYQTKRASAPVAAPNPSAFLPPVSYVAAPPALLRKMAEDRPENEDGGFTDNDEGPEVLDETPKPGGTDDFFPVLAEIGKARQKRDELSAKKAEAADLMVDAYNRLVGYFAQPATTRMSMASFTKVAQAYYGDRAQAVLPFLHGKYPNEKHASDDEVLPPISRRLMPLTALDEYFVRLKQAYDAGREHQDLHIRICGMEEKIGLTKSAGLLPDMGATLSTAMGVSMGAGGKPEKSDVPGLFDDLTDPQQAKKMNQMKASSTLAHILSDPDDPITGHDLPTIVAKANEIASLAPHLARNPAALKPVLRRWLQNNTQPFELQELSNLERAVSPDKRPPMQVQNNA